ncbi:alcohol dehydrogenase catalytic domain-containing protein [Dactylosporangium sp. AC04546]|uniref:zinc-binding dehydrogenase n=1 Tax=Dactylosporangium sp. AC04546 TaxID=2862460 RepID=UPI001EDECC45|nr:zinc-binding dehydrogenase [Dactylosporangium sp. AC04546]WVK86953.1 alcohol dehydrogenase catalytic domain-containing protein [Dactylosporangium sp. AC04546]
MKMRAAVLRAAGLPAPFATSRPFDVTEVELSGPGHGEVLVRVAAAGLCHSDLSAVTGDRPRRLPAVAGHEAAGVVEEVGGGVTGLAPGDHVVMVFVASCGECAVCLRGRPNLCQSSWQARAEGTLQTGTRRLSVAGESLNHWSGISAFAEYAVVTPRSIVRVDADIPLDIAAIFGCAVVTGVGAVMNTAQLTPGSSAAVVGLGGVGLSALLGAIASGARKVAAIDLSHEKLGLAQTLGATHVYDAGEPDCADRILQEFGAADFVFEMAGSARAARLAYTITGRGGTMVTAGLPNPSQQLEIPLADLVATERTVKGSYMGSASARRDIPRYLDLFRAGRLPVDRLRSATLALDDINEGFDRMLAGTSVRDVVVPLSAS